MEEITQDNLRHHLLEECIAMVKHLSADGQDIPKHAASLLRVNVNDDKQIMMDDAEVLQLHRQLSRKLAPARPKTVWLLYKEAQKAKWLNFLGPVNLIRRLMLTAIVSLFLFIGLSLSPAISVTNIEDGIYRQNGVILLIVLLFYLASASLGASFSNLFQANKYIINNTFDPKYESVYWVRFVLGIIAGILMAVVIPLPVVTDTSNAISAHMALVSRPLLAMLGGFSAALVYRILYRMVYAVESLFMGKQDEETERKISEIQSTNEIMRDNEQQKHINNLLAIQGKLTQGKTPEEMKEEIKKAIEEISSN